MQMQFKYIYIKNTTPFLFPSSEFITFHLQYTSIYLMSRVYSKTLIDKNNINKFSIVCFRLFSGIIIEQCLTKKKKTKILVRVKYTTFILFIETHVILKIFKFWSIYGGDFMDDAVKTIKSHILIESKQTNYKTYLL